MRAVPARWALCGILLAALVLRTAWPLADPPELLSWSTGEYTDPAWVVHGARNAILFGDWVRDESRDVIFYPLLNGITWVAYRLFGVSRLTTQILAALFGTLTVGGVFLAVRRGRGANVALLAAGAVALSYWLAMFARVPIAENLVSAMLIAACVAALGRGRAALVAAGFLAGIATFLGKVHAIAFFPALAAFLVLRGRRVSAGLPALWGFLAAGALWAGTIGWTFRAEIGDQLANAGDLYGKPAVLRSPKAAGGELIATLQASWMFHRMPLVAALGGLFVVGTLLDRDLRRRRLEDGTALFAFWFVAAWAMLTVLPYKAPRYFVLAGLPLVVAGACQLADVARGNGRLVARRSVLVIWCLLGGIVAVDAGGHVLALGQYLGRGVGDAIVRGLLAVRPQWAHYAAGAVIAVVAITFALRPPPPLAAWLRSVPPRTLAIALGGLSLIVDAAQFGNWALDRSYAIEDAKASLDAIIGEDAVLFGAFAPLLVQDSRRVGVPQFGEAEPGVVARRGLTHVVFQSTNQLADFERANPDVVGLLMPVQWWPLRSRHVRALELYRVAGTAYTPTLFERAIAELYDGRPNEALAALEEHRRSGGTVGPDYLAAEARAYIVLGDLSRGRESLSAALALQPANPDLQFQLGNVLAGLGEDALAREAWNRARKLDPYDDRVVDALRWLDEQGGEVAGP